ncbi:IMPACT family protein [Luteimonas aquatica]|uniref:IMPACT family protein n=1 Tax=Luteimonas aquatica TaxID=450364 RepID=UPI001F58382C|nr:YigZ family protein [Luteimonas aquatica]
MAADRHVPGGGVPDRSTLAAASSHAVEIKHSRFLAQAAPAASAQAALAFVEAVSAADATHNCWAYRIGDHYRSSDDGEPAGTAGRPILAAIDGQGLDGAVVVVTRWYGGIKLGAGGLIRAYGGAAAECLRRAERVQLIVLAELEVHAGFDDLGHVHAALGALAAEKLEERFDVGGAVLRLRLPADRVDALKTLLRDATRDRVRFGQP